MEKQKINLNNAAHTEEVTHVPVIGHFRRNHFKVSVSVGFAHELIVARSKSIKPIQSFVFTALVEVGFSLNQTLFWRLVQVIFRKYAKDQDHLYTAISINIVGSKLKA